MIQANQAIQPRAASDTMTAAVIAGPGEVTLRATPRPVPAGGQARVRLEGCGVCASNVPVWEGRPWFAYPMAPGAPGHEGWGRIDALGPNVDHLEVGQRVACLAQEAYAPFVLAEANQLVPLPAALDGLPFPGEPAGCAMNILDRAEIRPGQRVAIVGMGFLGHLLAQLCQAAGARVIAVSRRASSLERVRRMGTAEHRVHWSRPWEAVQAVQRIAGQAMCARVIETTGKQEGLELAGELTGERGRLIVAGYHQDGPRQVNMQQWNWKGLDVINAHERDPRRYVRGVEAAVTAVARGRLKLEPLLTHTLPLTALGRALDLARDRPDGFMKAVVMM